MKGDVFYDYFKYFVLDKYTIISHEGKNYTLEAINDERIQ